MTSTDPLILRCLALTGSFETGLLPPGCFGKLAGDFDGMGLSYSALQWNIGQATLQPLLRQMLKEHPEVMARCFQSLEGPLQVMLGQPTPMQLGWARGIQGVMNHVILPQWVSAFEGLGATPEWQGIAMTSAAGYFDHAKFLASQLGITSDRGMALLFDVAVQGGLSKLAERHAAYSPSQGELERMQLIAQAVADSAIAKWRVDVLSRKMCIANGGGIVHGMHFDLAQQFALGV